MVANLFIFTEKLHIHTLVGMYCVVLTVSYTKLQLIYESSIGDFVFRLYVIVYA